MKGIFISCLCILKSMCISSQTLVSDFFDSTAINSRWYLVNPNPASRTQLSGNGELLILASALNGGSDFSDFGNYNAPRLFQKIDTANHFWTVETKLRFNPTVNYQGAGLMIQTSNKSDSIRSTIRICERFFWRNITPNQNISCGPTTVPFTDTIIYFRCQRSPDSIRAWYSNNNTTWNYGGSIPDRPVFAVGLCSIRGIDGNLNIDSYAYFDYFKVTNGILPLTFVDLIAVKKARSIELLWHTQNEFDNYKFIVERAIESGNFKEIGNVGSKSGTANSYSYNDNIGSVSGKVLYYKIKQIDKDGKFTYSKHAIVILNTSNKTRIFPNPVTSTATINLQTENVGVLQIRLVNTAGRVLSKMTYTLSVGNNLIPLNTKHLATGVYAVIVSGKYTNEHMTLIKQ